MHYTQTIWILTNQYREQGTYNMGILNKWFGKKPETKSGGGMSFHNLFTPVQWQIFLNMDAGDGIDVFKKLWVAYKATMMIGENVSSLPMLVEDNKGNKVAGDEINNKEVQSLLYHPNPLDSGIDLIKQYTNFLVMNGNGYILIVDSAIGNPDYWVLASQNVEPIEGDPSKGEPILKGYAYTTQKGRQIVYPPESIIQVKDFNPASRIKGMSRISAGVSEVSFAEQMSNYKNSLYRNQATIPGALSTDGSLTDEQFQRLSKQFREDHEGTSNAGKHVLLEAGLKFTPMALSPTDLGMIKSETMTEAKICSLYGVPPELLNLTDQKNYSNYKEARRGFYTETVLPTGKQVWAALNRYFFPDGNMRFVIDKSEIDILRPEAEELNTSWWMTPNQKRKAQGLSKSDDPLMDEIYIPSSLMPMDLMGGGDNNNL